MQVNVRFSGAKAGEFGELDYEAILRRSLERLGRRVRRVSLYLEDVNGPRGGVDKEARLVVHLKRMQPVVIQDRDDDVTSLVNRVANRAAYVLSQKADRKSRVGSRLKEQARSLANQAADMFNPQIDPSLLPWVEKVQSLR